MAQSQDVFGLQARTVAVGLSQIIGVTISANVNSALIQTISGGSFMEVGGASLTWGQGFRYVGIPIAFNCTGTFYLCSSGSTAVANILFGLSSTT